MRVLSLASLFLLLQIPMNAAQQQQPKAAIEGIVTRLDSGQPIVGARVTIRRQGAAQTAGARGASTAQIAPATTDDKGRFTIQGLDEGSYTAQAQANGYVPQNYGQSVPNAPSTPITLTAGETKKDVKFSLTPTANISGRVRDTSDQPLVNVPVQLLRSSYDFNGQRRYQSIGTTQTNDRGEYRMYWVPPGRYYLLAGNPSFNPLSAAVTRNIMGGGGANGNEVPPIAAYAFYPGVTEIGNASTINLQVGTEQTIDMTLSPNPQTYRVRGKLVDARSGQSPPQATVTLARATPGIRSTDMNSVLIGNRNYDGTTGLIEFRDVLPGVYLLTAVVRDPAAARSGPSVQSAATISVNVPDADVDGIVLTLVPAGSITGRLRLEGQFSSPIDRFRVLLYPIGSTAQAQDPIRPEESSVSADGSFRVNNLLPGDYRIEVTSGPARIMVGGIGFIKEARFDGADVVNTPLRVSGSGAPVLDLVIASAGGTVQGVVTGLRSQPIPGTQVVLIPDRARYRPEMFRTATTDRSGSFSISTVPPGDYKVFSWEGLEEFSWFDPDVLAQSETRGATVRISGSSTEKVDVRIIPSQGTR